MSDLCPCASGKQFGECCEPYLLGQKDAPRAVDLMRARYTAYALGDINFLRNSASARVRKEFDAESSRKWAESAEWSGIEILALADGGENDARGVVEFIAHYKVEETEFKHHERAEFARVGKKWIFLDGKIFGPEPVRREVPKVGRNELCPCGSGKKFKKCCSDKEQV